MMTPHHIISYLLIVEMNAKLETFTQIGKNCTRCSLSEKQTLPEYDNESGIYEIRLKGQLDEKWANRFGGFTITLEDNGDTLLTGLVVDQAALHGLLKRIRDLGMPLLSINFVNPGQVKAQEVKS
jgi:hypothetical protein